VGARYFGWETWDDLIKRPRVVVLAEAGAGKTWEFQGHADRLVKLGKPAFFLAIEELADSNVSSCLLPSSASQLETWRSGSEIGHFFLDSVDEARLNGKKLAVALRKLAHDIGEHIGRAHIVVSCRVSDWKGDEDVAVVKQCLPYRLPPAKNGGHRDPHHKLLGPIFERKKNNEARQA
jgi:hypothetical protein